MGISHREIADSWVAFNSEGEYNRSERSGFNVYYRGDTIYSYGSHFPIASFATGPTGERVVLFTDRSYSFSTAKHKGIVNRALGYRLTLNVADPSSRCWSRLAEECAGKAKALRESAKRRRSDWRREHDEEQAAGYTKSAQLFRCWANAARKAA